MTLEYGLVCTRENRYAYTVIIQLSGGHVIHFTFTKRETLVMQKQSVELQLFVSEYTLNCPSST